MNAISFLIARRWKSPKKVGLLLFLVVVLGWVNFKLSTMAVTVLPFMGYYPSLRGLWEFLGGLGYLAAVVGCSVVVPLFTLYKLTNTLQTWIRQRAIEEMCCTGLTARYLLDRMVLFGVKWWLIAALPGSAMLLMLSGGYQERALPVLLGSYLFIGFVITYLGLYGTCWHATAGATGKVPVLASLLVVMGVPGFGLVYFEGSLTAFIVAGIYTIIVAREFAIYALENRETITQFNNKVRRTFRRRRSISSLDSNPIVAREQMRGQESGELMTRLLMAAGYLFGLFFALLGEGLEAFSVVVVPAVFVFSYRAAGKMSQIVTDELESQTLETIRSTPMGSGEFLRGWLRLVLRQIWIDMTILLLAIVPVVFMVGEYHLFAYSMFWISLLAAYVMPIVAALVGASIAGQGKPREQISGQLFLAVSALAVFGTPYSVVIAGSFPLPIGLLCSGVAVGFLCWVLEAGAQKSLNRVFLPQK